MKDILLNNFIRIKLGILPTKNASRIIRIVILLNNFYSKGTPKNLPTLLGIIKKQ